MYVKVINNIVEKYPYSIKDLIKENQGISFPSELPDSLLNEYGIFKVEPTDCPIVGFDKNVNEATPKLINGVWKQAWQVTDATYEEHLARVLEARANEYPPISDYLDGLVKNDQAQIDKYIADCLAVKIKYPKPSLEK